MWEDLVSYDSANEFAQPGTLSIRFGLDFSGSLVGLPGTLLDEQAQVKEGCARRNPRANSLLVRGKGGVSSRPDGLLPLDSTTPVRSSSGDPSR